MLRTGRPSWLSGPDDPSRRSLNSGRVTTPSMPYPSSPTSGWYESKPVATMIDPTRTGMEAAPGSADPDVHDVVAEATGPGNDLRSREDRDGRPSLHLGHQACDQLPPVLAVRVHLAESPDPAAQCRLTLDEGDREADVGQADGGPQARDPAADDQRSGRRLDHDRLERRGQPCVGDPGADQAQGLVGRRRFVVRVHPRALFADVDLGVLVGIHARTGCHAPERVGVELRRAGGHDEAVEAEPLDVLG